jgi:hypothetical protein
LGMRAHDIRCRDPRAVESETHRCERESLGRAIDLVDAVDEVMGEKARVGGDRQFRLYVYLKPAAVDVLSKSSEFIHDRDNAVYHKGFPPVTG